MKYLVNVYKALSNTVEVEAESEDADEAVQDVYSVSAEDGCTLINKGRN